MAFLIVDPDRQSREATASMVTWVDRRHRVDFAIDGTSALAVAVERRPKIVFVEPRLPDMSGTILCTQLRQRLPRLTCVAFSNDELISGFDGVLSKPPSRLEMLSVIETAKRNGKHAKSVRSEVQDERRLPRTFIEEVPAGPTATLLLSLADETMMKFGVPVPLHSTVEAALKQIGKASVPAFSLHRNGAKLDATLETFIRHNDHLILHP